MASTDAVADVIDLMLRRDGVVESLLEKPKNKHGLVDELDISRSTIDRAIGELESVSLVAYSDDEVEPTLCGRLAAEEYRRLEAHVDGLCCGTNGDGGRVPASQWITAVAQRASMIESLGTDLREKRRLVDELGVSRSTVDRAMRELEGLGMIEYVSGGLQPTEIGRRIIREYSTFEERLNGLVAASDLLGVLDADVDIDPAVLVGAEIVFPGEVAPSGPGDRVLELIRGATRCKILSRAHAIPDSGDVIQQEMGQNGMDYEGVFQSDMLDHLRSEQPVAIAKIATRDTCTLTSIESLPFGLCVIDRTDATYLCVVTYTDENQFGGLIINDSEDAIEWGNQTYDRYRQQAERVDV